MAWKMSPFVFKLSLCFPYSNSYGWKDILERYFPTLSPFNCTLADTRACYQLYSIGETCLGDFKAVYACLSCPYRSLIIHHELHKATINMPGNVYSTLTCFWNFKVCFYPTLACVIDLRLSYANYPAVCPDNRCNMVFCSPKKPGLYSPENLCLPTCLPGCRMYSVLNGLTCNTYGLGFYEFRRARKNAKNASLLCNFFVPSFALSLTLLLLSLVVSLVLVAFS